MPNKLSIFKGRSKFRLVGDFILELARKNPSLKSGQRNITKVSSATRRQLETKMHSEENSNNG